jgi:hypothetical protein
MKRRNKGMLLASTVAALFIANAALAEQGSEQMSTQGGQSAQAKPVKCAGVNACKGQSACKSATSSGPGQNACKGMGLVVTQNLQQCLARGGYALNM